ncbi:hypothetical protein ID0642_04430 [Helicobacter pylori]
MKLKVGSVKVGSVKVGSVKVGSVKAANALLNHLKFLFLGLR